MQLRQRLNLRTRRLAFNVAAPPAIPNSPFPANGATRGFSPTLGWQAYGATGYDVYFGITPTPPLVSTGQSIAQYVAGVSPLIPTTYYWQIVAFNQYGTVTGPVWSFQILPDPEPIDDNSTTLLRDSQIKLMSNMAQQRTRFLLAGAGGTIAADTPVGSTTVDINEDAINTFSGGQAQIGCQRITYVSVVRGDDLTPDPTRIGSATNTPDVLGELVIGATYRWGYTFQRDSDGAETGMSPIAACVVTVQGASGNAVNIDLTQCDEAPAGYTRCWYRTSANGSDFVRLPVLYPLMGNQFHYAFDRDPGNIVLFDGVGDEWRGFVSSAFRDNQDPPTGNKDPIEILSWAAGSPTVIESIGNHNLTDNDWVAILGAGAQINGKHKILVVDPTHFSIDVVSKTTGSGGQFQQQVFYYAEEDYITPHQDPSTVQYAFPYNQHTWTLSPDPFPRKTIITLKGVTGITEILKEGREVNIFLQYDDAVLQTALGLQEGGDGIREDYIKDTSMPTYAAMAARGAVLAGQFGRPVKEASYSTIDVNSAKDRIVSINLTWPPIVESLRIQTVGVSEIHDSTGYPAKRNVTASSIKFDLDDLLRKISGR